MPPKRYPGFDYAANELIKFLAATNFFTILLVSGDIVHFFPDNVDTFYKWLLDNNVQDMRAQK